MPRKKTVSGRPGETGVTEGGIPWYVPEERPGRGERFRRWLSPSPGDPADASVPPGARLVPARTTDEVRERCTRKYGGAIADLLDKDEELHGFADFGLDQNVPLPPQANAEVQPAPDPHWWMGGDWDTTAGQLVSRIDDARTRGQKSLSVLYRGMLWIRTSRRILVMGGNMDTPAWKNSEYALDEVGLHPNWQPSDSAKGTPYRVDIAFADGSWLGVTGLTTRVPGGTEGYPDRDLLAELAGPPVTDTVLPALER